MSPLPDAATASAGTPPPAKLALRRLAWGMFWLLAALLTACDGSFPTQAPAGVDTGPALDRSASVLGPDTNANGIRDDIEAWIDSRNDRTAAQKDAMRQVARAFQAELAAERTTPAALEAHRVVMDARNCVESRSSSFDDYIQVVQQIGDYTRNTLERVRASMAIDRLLSGQSWSLASGDTCDPRPPSGAARGPQ